MKRKQPTMRPIIDEAQVAIDFPDKVYIGSFNRTSSYEVKSENGGLALKLRKNSQPKRTFEMHLHHYLLVDILGGWAESLHADKELEAKDREELAEAIDAVSASLKRSK